MRRTHICFCIALVVLGIIVAGCSYDGLPVVGSESVPSCNGYLSSTDNSNLTGYTPKLIYAPGEQLELKVSSPNRNFSLSIYREGTTSEVKLSRSKITAPLQPLADLPFSTNANWSTVFSTPIPQDWPTGLYNALLIEPTTQKCFELVFAINTTPKIQPHIAVVLPDYTWQAYNNWGKGSFYSCETPCSGAKYANILTSQRPNPQLYFRRDGVYHHMGRAYVRLLSWLDKNNYGYTLISDSQMESTPNRLDGYSVLILGAHNEYWTRNMRQNLEGFLARGGNLINWGGNNIYWKIVARNDQIEVRKDGSQHTLDLEPGGKWRNLGQSEAAILGSRFTDAGMGQFKNAKYQIMLPEHWAFAGIDIQTKLTTEESCSGWETDKIDPQFSPKNIQVIARGLNPPDSKYPATEPTGADMTYYDHPGGGGVFSAGSIGFLSCTNDPVVSRIMSNVVDHFLSR